MKPILRRPAAAVPPLTLTCLTSRQAFRNTNLRLRDILTLNLKRSTMKKAQNPINILLFKLLTTHEHHIREEDENFL